MTKDVKHDDRSLKELISLLIDKISLGNYRGLCEALTHMQGLTYNEFDQLSCLIDRAKPTMYQLRYYCEYGVYKQGAAGYYWPKFAVKPRVKWLRKQLRLCS